ncbi:alpha/beta hydrolase [Pannus brasiliensis CCIBt3594]|uniref:Alpha/beta hydrolase n=1 Tax=Pannus brasiliensis CCIBt3594 TaxID=1427578 RepID=A0AAW9QYW7_9CHRO
MKEQSVRWFFPRPPRPDYPLFVFLPGMDGSGQLYHRQIATLSSHFDLRCLTISPRDTSDWDELADAVIDLLEEELRHKSEKLYLCGESFGGCLALKIAIKAPKMLKKLILVNAASSFNQRPVLGLGIGITQYLPDFLHRGSALALLPFIASLSRMSAEDRRSLLKAMRSVPQEIVSWRLSMLQRFRAGSIELSRLHFSVLVVASKGDRLLPSVAEGQRLVHQLPKAKLVILPESGHTCLLEADIHLKEILGAHGCLPRNLPDRLQK